jgi:hypothetical protein
MAIPNVTKTLIHCWWEHRTTLEIWQFVAKLYIFLPYDLAIELTSTKAPAHRCYEALFITAKTWRQ